MLFHLFVFVRLFCCLLFCCLLVYFLYYVNQILKCNIAYLPYYLEFCKVDFHVKIFIKNQCAIKYFDAKICRCENSERVYKHLV